MRQPELTNPLQPNSFTFVIDGQREFVFEIQSAELPPLSVGAVATDHAGNQVFVPGDKATFSSASINFVVDEKMIGYLSVFKWLLDSTDADEIANVCKDVIILINNAQNLPNVECRLINAIPTSLSGISLTTADTEPLIATLDLEVDSVEYRSLT